MLWETPGGWYSTFANGRGLFCGESVVASFLRRTILRKKGEETFCLGEKIKTSFSEARMGSCVVNYEFILFFLLPSQLQLISQQLFAAVLRILPGPHRMAAVTHNWAFLHDGLNLASQKAVAGGGPE